MAPDRDVARPRDHDTSCPLASPRGFASITSVKKTAAVAGGFGTDQRAAPGQRPSRSARRIRTHWRCAVLPEQEPELAGADPDVPCWHVGIVAELPVQLGHEALTKAHHFGIATFPSGSKSEPPLAPPRGNAGQAVLEDLLEGQELEQPSVTVGCPVRSFPSPHSPPSSGEGASPQYSGPK